MAINFPDSPVLNQVFTSAGRRWRWDGTTWISLFDKGNVDISDTPPLNPSLGDLWYDSSTGICFVYYYDGNSYQWADIGSGGNTTLNPLSAINSPTVNLSYNTTTRILSAGINNGFIFVPLNDPTNPLNNNSNVNGVNVISFAATGNTSATPYTGTTQTANLASIVPDNAYMVLVRLETSNNTNESNNFVSDVYVYLRKNSSDSWRTGLFAETYSTTIEANEMDTFPLIFDRATKTFQAYLYHNKVTGVTFSSAPQYSFTVNVLGYYIK